MRIAARTAAAGMAKVDDSCEGRSITISIYTTESIAKDKNKKFIDDIVDIRNTVTGHHGLAVWLFSRSS
jgi:hypothetical protein